MDSNSSLALVGRPEDKLPVMVSPASSNVLGPGRLLYHAYSYGGLHMEKTIGHVAHRFGYGPAATAERIVEAFGDQVDLKQSLLDDIYDSFDEIPFPNDKGVRELEMKKTEKIRAKLAEDCVELVKYALP
jgi:hypothetical protein